MSMYKFKVWVYKYLPFKKVNESFLEKTYFNFFGLKILLRIRAGQIDISPALNAVVDITKCPKAKGKRRLLQLANVKLLKLFTLICKKYDIPYYLCGGTLLGAVRHKGVIPWDDDIDVSVPTEMIDKVNEVLEKELADTNIKIWGIEDMRFRTMTTRLSHKKLPSINVDIFYPYCMATKPEDRDRVYKAWKKSYDNYRKMVDELAKGDVNRESIYKTRKATEAFYKQELPELVDFFDPRATYMTTELHWHSYRYIPMSDVLPLKEIEFEGEMFYAPAKPENYVSGQYGDYMSFPPYFDHHGSLFGDFEEDEMIKTTAELDELIRRYEVGAKRI